MQTVLKYFKLATRQSEGDRKRGGWEITRAGGEIQHHRPTNRQMHTLTMGFYLLVSSAFAYYYYCFVVIVSAFIPLARYFGLQQHLNHTKRMRKK